MNTHVLYEERGAIAFVRLERTEQRNALTGAMLKRLAGIFNATGVRRDLRAVVLSAAGADFCAGTDASAPDSADEESAGRSDALAREVCDAVELCGTPVIAAVQGLAADAGCELALACHLRVAAPDARFTLRSGEEVAAEEALRRGLVNRAVAPSELFSEAEALARAIADTTAPLAVRACLEAVTRGMSMSLREGLELETELFSRLFSTADAREGVRAFLEKRTPVFRGK